MICYIAVVSGLRFTVKDKKTKEIGDLRPMMVRSCFITFVLKATIVVKLYDKVNYCSKVVTEFKHL